MSTSANRLRSLFATVLRYLTLGRSRCSLYALRLWPTMVGGTDIPAIERPVGNDHHLVKHGPIQITTVQGDPIVTQDGVTVQVAATLAWSNALPGAVETRQRAGRSTCNRSPVSNPLGSATALTREALHTIVPGCGLAALLCERHDAEEQVRQDVAHRAEASGLIVHLVRIRTIDIPASVQAAGDMQQLSAIRACTKRRCMANRRAQTNPQATAIGHLTW